MAGASTQRAHAPQYLKLKVQRQSVNLLVTLGRVFPSTLCRSALSVGCMGFAFCFLVCSFLFLATQSSGDMCTAVLCQTLFHSLIELLRPRVIPDSWVSSLEAVFMRSFYLIACSLLESMLHALTPSCHANLHNTM